MENNEENVITLIMAARKRNSYEVEKIKASSKNLW